MEEYTVTYLNGITTYLMAGDWRDSILEAKLHAQRKGFSQKIKYIMDEDGTVIKNIDEIFITFNYVTTNLNKIYE